jgi:hypothetical protein
MLDYQNQAQTRIEERNTAGSGFTISWLNRRTAKPVQLTRTMLEQSGAEDFSNTKRPTLLIQNRVSNGNLIYNVPYTLLVLNKMYMYTLFLNALILKCTQTKFRY